MSEYTITTQCVILASRQGFGELKTEQLGGHSQEQQRHRQAPIDDEYHFNGEYKFAKTGY